MLSNITTGWARFKDTESAMEVTSDETGVSVAIGAEKIRLSPSDIRVLSILLDNAGDSWDDSEI